jgi:hypothetical protein
MATSPGPRPWLDPRFLVAAAAGTALAALAIGIPTDVVPNPLFTRMTPADASNYFFWVTTSVVTGALLGTYALAWAGDPRASRAGLGGGILGYLAVGCPICNKLVVALLGVSGALTYFAPIQPVLGAAGLGLATLALALRLRGIRQACALPG